MLTPRPPPSERGESTELASPFPWKLWPGRRCTMIGWDTEWSEWEACHQTPGHDTHTRAGKRHAMKAGCWSMRWRADDCGYSRDDPQALSLHSSPRSIPFRPSLASSSESHSFLAGRSCNWSPTSLCCLHVSIHNYWNDTQCKSYGSVVKNTITSIFSDHDTHEAERFLRYVVPIRDEWLKKLYKMKSYRKTILFLILDQRLKSSVMTMPL